MGGPLVGPRGGAQNARQAGSGEGFEAIDTASEPGLEFLEIRILSIKPITFRIFPDLPAKKTPLQ